MSTQNPDAPDTARQTINQWVEDNTKSKIQNILQKAPGKLTRLILTNAIYFTGSHEEETYLTEPNSSGEIEMITFE